MQLHEAFQLVEALGVEEANQRIQQEGGKLLAITQRERVGSVYVLGKAGPVDPKPKTDWEAMVG
ncbi:MULTISPECIES: hypothetical protein [Pseudomonas syringae group]|uniref:Uncharacterized protein n=3 Tax=Pseudomonas syringae group TaxID=136849 RepID=A0A656GPZ8_PSEA0|nr:MULTISPECIES: hypothetical protein [Pseudomonas syringae group]EGH25032.1 hypothetical protein PSYMO_27696 [Pseudomonas amygdali pv. mori str. 301020]KWT11587.1 hypothetical protein AL047_12935 [Pseudomonas syringae pv. broussonetiae]EGH27310.1 hypothetical protein PSYMO_39800 [Pseudomonas amygdali pv. mori str. 301020]KAA8693206.1 hypothetical protein F4W70_29795 [Pseudomonas cannabina]KPW70078.1 hypothetical protein ALO81_200149 [Pseudomonas cannabina]